MKTIRLARRNRTALLFLLSYLLVMAVPFAISTFYFYPRLRSTLTDNAMERASISVRQTAAKVDEQLANVMLMPQFIFESKRIILRNVMSDPISLKEAQDDLAQMILTNTFIDHLLLYIRDSDYFIGANANSFYIDDISRFPGLYQTSFSDWSPDELHEIMETISTQRILPVTTAVVGGKQYDKMLLSLAPVPNSRFAKATLLMCIPAANLNALIDMTQSADATYLFWDAEGTLLYSTDAVGMDDCAAIASRVFTVPSGCEEAALQNGSNLLTWSSSALYGWRYAQVMPMSGILGETGALQHSATVIMVSVLLACIGLIALAMRMNYLPIKRLALMAQGDQTDRTGDDFSVIQRLVQRLTNENDELGERLNWAEPQAREALISQLFSGSADEQSDALSRAELFGIELNAPCYRVALAEYPDAAAAENACARLCADSFDGLIVAQTDTRQRVAVLIGAEQAEGLLDARLSDAQHIAYGMCVEEASQISLSYGSACAALDILHTSGMAQRVLNYDQLPERSFNPRSYPLEVMQSLETAIAHGNAERFDTLMAQLESLIALEDAPPYFTRSVYFNVINLLISGLARHLGEDNELVREIGMHSMLNHYSAPEMVHILQLTANQLAQRMREGEHKNAPVTEALRYIEENASSPTLCLQEVADCVGMSASTFSRSFKEKVGRNFKEFVDATRILRAKKLLSGTDTPIEQIASSVGYDTLTSFYRMFKKCVGVAPGEYRQAQSHNGSGKKGAYREN